MKKVLSVLLIVAAVAAFGGVGIKTVVAATDNDPITVNLNVNATIAINCSEPITMGAITGTGKSDLTTNSTTCNVKTNNNAGYKLEWTASTAAMTSGGDTIGAYTPGTSNIPETWSVGAAAAEWGARLSSTSTTAEAEWGTDDQSGVDYGTTSKWLNVATSARQIADRVGTKTSAGGDDEVVNFGAEVGSSIFQATGTYTVDVTFTATTL
ncbi:hypothetical protein EPO05_04550 [Patescibacteria group bacterium]|nr:MAG: hypothetical protein EPO05_04550 [Patescibacteria group bacterium]